MVLSCSSPGRYLPSSSLLAGVASPWHPGASLFTARRPSSACSRTPTDLRVDCPLHCRVTAAALHCHIGIRRPSRRSVICASLFGVGAPEALVIGVVALLVFGPKGLAEVARNLGKTLRAFQPTIRELQDVSREFRSTLEREIGIDEVPPSTSYRPTTTNYSQPPAVDPNAKPETTPYTSEELMKVTEEQLAASAAAAWNPQPVDPKQPQESEAVSTSQSNDGAPSGGNDGPAAAGATKPDSSQANQPVKMDTRDEAA